MWQAGLWLQPRRDEDELLVPTLLSAACLPAYLPDRGQPAIATPQHSGLFITANNLQQTLHVQGVIF